ncbi:hypothetical protein LB505_005652 [Fusarium chuoi]|nr:hypothetical protein LB505_005652 [Fusarium chuoi]
MSRKGPIPGSSSLLTQILKEPPSRNVSLLYSFSSTVPLTTHRPSSLDPVASSKATKARECRQRRISWTVGLPPASSYEGMIFCWVHLARRQGLQKASSVTRERVT